jgi:hypothetical protein
MEYFFTQCNSLFLIIIILCTWKSIQSKNCMLRILFIMISLYMWGDATSINGVVLLEKNQSTSSLADCHLVLIPGFISYSIWCNRCQGDYTYWQSPSHIVNLWFYTQIIMGGSFISTKLDLQSCQWYYFHC